MAFHELRLFFRTIQHQKFSTILNVVSLTIGLTAVFFIAILLNFELGYDRFHKNGDSIALLGMKGQFGGDQSIYAPLSSAQMAVDISNRVSSIESFTRVDPWKGRRNIRYEDQTFSGLMAIYADSTFFTHFSFPLVKGDKDKVLQDKFSLVLNQSTAIKIFGEKDPIGKAVVIDNDPNQTYTVTGVMADFDKPTHMPNLDVIFSWSSQGIPDEAGWMDQMGWLTYFKLSDGTKAKDLEKQINGVLDEFLGEQLEAMGSTMHLSLLPLRDIYLSSKEYDYYPYRLGSMEQVRQFTIIGFFILIISVLNFVNLATAKSSLRARHVGLSKVLGASKGRLILQYMTEAFLITIISMAISIALVWLLLPHFSMMVNSQLTTNLLTQPGIILLLLGITLLVAFFAGAYPSFYLSAFQPAEVLKGKIYTGKKGRFRNGIVLVQFIISITLIISAVVVLRQMDYMKNKDLGYSLDRVLMIRMNNPATRARYETFLNEAEKIPNVKVAGSTDIVPFSITYSSSFHVPGDPMEKQTAFYVQDVGHKYVDVLGMKIVEGRNFSREIKTDNQNAIIVNETALKTLGWDTAVGKEIEMIQSVEPLQKIPFKIIGVVSDFNFNSLHTKIQPLFLSLHRGAPEWVMLKIEASEIEKTIGKIDEAWRGFSPEEPMDYRFMNGVFQRQYLQEIRLSTTINVFTFLAVFLALLGLFALSLFVAEQKNKEVGIRKVLGATTSSVAIFFTGRFLKMVLFANLLAWPIGYFTMDKWLMNYAYRISIDWWIFPLSASMALIFAGLTVFFQFLRASSINPIDTIRNE